MLSDNVFEFKLRRPIEVHGEDEDVDALVFHECGAGYDRHYMRLRKGMMAGVVSTPEVLKRVNMGASKDEDDIKGGSVVEPLHKTDDTAHAEQAAEMAAVLCMVLGTTDELEMLVKHFNAMIAMKSGSPICETPSGKQVKEGAWNALHPEDKIAAAVGYCCFFGIGLDSMKPPASDTASSSLSVVKDLSA